MGVFEGCLIDEELAYGCSGIKTAIASSGLGVNTVVLI
jgi:acyl-CoA dehydrogenase